MGSLHLTFCSMRELLSFDVLHEIVMQYNIAVSYVYGVEDVLAHDRPCAGGSE